MSAKLSGRAPCPAACVPHPALAARLPLCSMPSTVPGTALLLCVPTASYSSLQGWGAPSSACLPRLSAPLQRFSGLGEAGVYWQIPVPVLSPRLAGDVAGDALRWWGRSSSLRVRAASRGCAGCIPAQAARQDARVPGVWPAHLPAAGPVRACVQSPSCGQELPREGSRRRTCKSCFSAGVGEPGMS